MKYLFAILIFLALMVSCMTSEGSLFETVVSAESGATEEPDGSEESEEPEEGQPSEEEVEEEIGLRIETYPDDAVIFLNNVVIGTSPLLVEPDSGTYKITADKDGYYAKTIWVKYEEGSMLIVEIELEMITGYLYLEVLPPGASVYLNGGSISTGVTELQIGRHNLLVRSFGYEDWRGAITIAEKQTTKVEAELKEAVFTLSDLRVSRRIFNPGNPGKLGTTRVNFDVNSWGNGEFVVSQAGGGIVYSRPLTGFTTWEQSLEWDGRDSVGRVLPDGEYTARIEASGLKEQEMKSLMTTLTIDSTAVISYRSVLSGVSGLLFSSEPGVLPRGSFQIDAGMMGHYSPALGISRYPTHISVRVGTDNGSEIDLHGGIYVGSEDNMPFFAGIGYKVQLPGSSIVDFGITSKLTYVGNTTIDTLVNYTGLSVGFTSAIQAGPLIFMLNPDILVSPYKVSYAGIPATPSFYAW
ncbi:MAG: PEGA domain-containing protein, partial [Spirochaetales bacterium]|nr:PEGA domain-containing protein [Spirochaetales bacterium]